MIVLVITGAVGRSNRHHQHTNRLPNFLQAGYPSCQPTVLEKGENITFHRLAHPKFNWGSSILVLTTRLLVTLVRVATPLVSSLTLVSYSYSAKQCQNPIRYSPRIWCYQSVYQQGYCIVSYTLYCSYVHIYVHARRAKIMVRTANKLNSSSTITSL